MQLCTTAKLLPFAWSRHHGMITNIQVPNKLNYAIIKV